MGEPDSPPVEIAPPPGPGKYWTRRGIAEWLAQRLAEDKATLVGIRHGFSFPLRYFEAHGLALDWPAFLDDFQRHWPTDDDHAYVDFVREGVMGNGADRAGDTSWRRLTEMRAGAARSLFHFQAPGSVGKATHAGLPARGGPRASTTPLRLQRGSGMSTATAPLFDVSILRSSLVSGRRPGSKGGFWALERRARPWTPEPRCWLARNPSPCLFQSLSRPPFVLLFEPKFFDRASIRSRSPASHSRASRDGHVSRFPVRSTHRTERRPYA